MRFLRLFILMALFVGCSANKNLQEFAKWGFLDGIYSTRPQAKNPLIVLIKLKTPALLETASRDQGKLKIDETQLKAIENEQAATIAALAKISPEIRVLIEYKRVLNALTILVPAEYYDQVASLPNVVLREKSNPFARPKSEEAPIAGALSSRTSVRFIGAEAAYAQNLRGEGIKVGVIDTGIDYTHKMFLGAGTAEAYKAINPAQADAGFPNAKVVGGIDLVGTQYDAASPEFVKRLPLPDLNPLDEAGHGTHVAGTIAGLGDGVKTYSGVAPAAELFAIKVFGARGSTSDEIVIAALEYAVDPSGDLNFDDQLDIVNLSLGSSYGNPHIMYNEAIKNLVRAGTAVVVAAGNSGDKAYIVGAPGTSEDAIAVASGIDNSEQNIQFPSAEFHSKEGTLNLEYAEGETSKPLKDIPALTGEVIAVGTAQEDFDPFLKEQIKGKIALIDRGVITFSEKIKKAQEAGALAVIVANNTEGDPFVMSGNGEKFEIPAIMISQSGGEKLKEELKKGPVTVDMKSKTLIEKPELVDTISSFSSRGPRSEDGLIKPEITAPGSNIISAQMGGGDQAAVLSGTSMATPHIAGTMALLKQKFKDLTPQELKSVLMGHGKVVADRNKKTYSVSRQGAGRVQIEEALEARATSLPAALSLGITDLEKQKTLVQDLTLKNQSAESLSLTAQWAGSPALQMAVPQITLAPGESRTVSITVKVQASFMQGPTEELDGFLRLADDKGLVLQIPVLVVARQISQIQADSAVVHATSAADSAGSLVHISLQNKGMNKGPAYLFNSLGGDARKIDRKPDPVHNRNCDLQSAGYRLIEKDGTRVLQIALKLYERMTTWNACEVNMQIDANGDGVADQEVAGTTANSLSGLTSEKFVTLLLDSAKAREMRKKYEDEIAQNVKDPKEDYSGALVDLRPLQVFDNSTLAIMEVDTAKLALANTGALAIKISTFHQDDEAIEMDDYLGSQDKNWDLISILPMAQAFLQLPESVEMQGQGSVTVPAVKGYGSGDLILYAPQNKAVSDVLLEDAQSQIVPVRYEKEN